MEATDQQKVPARCRKDKELEPRVNKELLKHGEKRKAILKGKWATLAKCKLQWPRSKGHAASPLRCELQRLRE